MAHSLWCGEKCYECVKSCGLDESMACSPDCDAFDPATDERDLSKCTGCDGMFKTLKPE